jgi:cytosine/adenosine deaminase-related metal-dependent hydrolase
LLPTKDFDLQNSSSTEAILHRAPWIVTGQFSLDAGENKGVIRDGAVLVVNDRIMEVGHYKDLAAEFSNVDLKDHDGSILTPALINGHSHLELSHLPIEDTCEDNYGDMNDMTDWIRNLLAQKKRFSELHHDFVSKILECGRQALDNMFAEGIGFVGDIGNHLESRMIGKDHPVQVSFLLEFMGITRETETKAIALLNNIAAEELPGVGFTAHASYSASPSLIQEIKRQSNIRENVFSVHVAESAEEIEFLQTGTGSFKGFLEDRGAWDNTFKPPATGTVYYLDQLGVLDRRTLCVHAVHIDEQEIDILANSQAKVCLCPCSNRHLGVGKAPVGKMLSAGILPAIGTDSLSSNKSLNIWQEMQTLREDHPELEPLDVFAMATIGGAAAWGKEDELGSLSPGKKGFFLSIKCQESFKNGKEVLDFLTSTGELIQTDWVG